MGSPLERYLAKLPTLDGMQWRGQVAELVGLLVESNGPGGAVGDICEIQCGNGERKRAQVVGFRGGRLLLMPMEETGGIQLGDRVVLRAEAARATVGPALLGRAIDAFGSPLDGGPAIAGEAQYDLYAPAPGPMEREPIREPLVTGIRAIDSLLPCGRGQRIGIFGGSGVGKSTLLGTMVRQSTADVAVIALIGERNREVRGFIEHELGPEGMRKSVVIVATSDRPAPLRIRAAFQALAVSEYFRDLGKDVLLVMDSVTRLAMAQREIGLAAGEPPSQKGYTPSVFNLLPKICERAGRVAKGSITGFFTVLVEGDDFNEPICDAVRGILDGHIILSRALGAAGHYPAIDILNSVSRLASQIATPSQKRGMQEVREAMAAFERSEDLINLGAYASGANPRLDRAVQFRPQMLDFLKQPAEEASSREETLAKLDSLAALLHV
ncbi:MAG: FliI/YscN family ATPase [Bryobacteraceae bacterium]|nr:FliI/YscN family ATPase [Bryobacteraceae bacterium]